MEPTLALGLVLVYGIFPGHLMPNSVVLIRNSSADIGLVYMRVKNINIDPVSTGVKKVDIGIPHNF